MNAPLLRRLREANESYLPLDALGDSLEQTRRDLEEIESLGFSIERHPLFGVAYRGPSDRLCPDQIEFALGTALVGRRVAVWNRVSSTNDLAARAARSSSNEGLVILAEEQTAGRGRRGRSWAAPPRSSLLMSVLLFPTGDLADPAWLTALAAVAVAEVVSESSPRPAQIKWPNDVRVGGRKVAGILVERGAGSVIGIGLNANTGADEFPPELRETATSLRILRGERVDRSELARELIRRLDEHYGRSRATGALVLNGPWRERSEHLGRSVRVDTPDGPVCGRLDDLGLRDGLALSTTGGGSRRIANREVLGILTLDG